MVDPTAEEADLVAREAGEAGWVGTTVAVRYSGEQLEGFMERLEPVVEFSDSIISIGPDHQINKVRVELNAFDLDSIRWLHEAVPSDVLVVSVQSGARYELLGDGRRRS